MSKEELRAGLESWIKNTRRTAGNLERGPAADVDLQRLDEAVRGGSGEELDVSPADAERLGLDTGTVVEVSSRRATIDMTVRVQPDLPTGLCFTTYHFAETTDVNQLTIDTWDVKSGTAEFKATAINVRPKEAVHA